MANETRYDDGIQHGIDNNPNGDAEKGAALGGIGGAVMGLAAGSMAGPVGAVLGAVIGGVAGAAASGAAVAAVDRVDNDNSISGVGNNHVIDTDADDNTVYETANSNYVPAPTYLTDDNGGRFFVDSEGRRIYTDETDRYYYTDINSGNRTYVAAPVWGTNVSNNSVDTYSTNGDYNTGIHGVNRLPGEAEPSLKTGGYANDGTPDTRGVGEKFVDAVTGDVVDDKTGKIVDHS